MRDDLTNHLLRVFDLFDANDSNRGQEAELQVWLLELGALHRGLVNLIATVRQGHSEVPVGFLFLSVWWDLGSKLAFHITKP